MSVATVGANHIYQPAGIEVEVIEEDATVRADEDEPGCASAAIRPHELRAFTFASIARIVREWNTEAIAITSANKSLECVFLKTFKDGLDDGDTQITGALCEGFHNLSQCRETALMAAGTPTLKAVEKFVASGKTCQSQGGSGRFTVSVEHLIEMKVGGEITFNAGANIVCHCHSSRVGLWVHRNMQMYHQG